MLVKTPFKKYKGAKHCLICDKYIPPTIHYNQKIYCDIHCQEIATILTRLKKLCEEKGLKLNLHSSFNKFEHREAKSLFTKIKAFINDIVCHIMTSSKP